MREIVRTHSDGAFELNLNFFRHHNEKVEYEWSGGSPLVSSLFQVQELEELFGFPVRENTDELEDRHFDLAHSVQAVYEEAFFNLLESSHAKYGIDKPQFGGWLCNELCC